MKLREAGARVGLGRPVPQGAARVGALLTQTGPEVGPDGFCRSCDQEVKPVVRRFWWHAALLVATAQLFAVIVSVVACFKTVDPWKGLRRRFVAWPAAIHPVGLGVAAAVVAALATAWFADFLNERAEQAASCPRCHKVLAEQGR